jgi:hypothetical protein
MCGHSRHQSKRLVCVRRWVGQEVEALGERAEALEAAVGQKADRELVTATLQSYLTAATAATLLDAKADRKEVEVLLEAKASHEEVEVRLEERQRVERHEVERGRAGQEAALQRLAQDMLQAGPKTLNSKPFKTLNPKTLNPKP